MIKQSPTTIFKLVYLCLEKFSFNQIYYQTSIDHLGIGLNNDVFEPNEKYNLLQDMIDLSNHNDDFLLAKLKSSVGAKCDYCLACADTMPMLYEYHGHIAPPYYNRTVRNSSSERPGH